MIHVDGESTVFTHYRLYYHRICPRTEFSGLINAIPVKVYLYREPRKKKRSRWFT